MIPSRTKEPPPLGAVYQRGLVIDSQLHELGHVPGASISKGIGD